MSPDEEQRLVKAAPRDSVAFRQLYNVYFPRVYAYVSYRVGSARWDPVEISAKGRAILQGVAAASTNDVWAVGYSTAEAPPFEPGGTRTHIELWDGKQWDESPSASPKDTIFNSLYGVAALPSGEVWAVGWSATTRGASKSLVLRYTKVLCQTPTATTP